MRSAWQVGARRSLASQSPVLVALCLTVLGAVSLFAIGTEAVVAGAPSSLVYQWGARGDRMILRVRSPGPKPWRVHGLERTVALGASASRFAVEADGSLWAWGNNASGQLGLGSLRSYRWPREVTGIGRVIQVAASPDHTLALLADGKVMSWGDNSAGQLGDGTMRGTLRPVEVRGLNGVASVATPADGWIAPLMGRSGSAGTRLRRSAESQGGYSIALKRNGTVWVWGSNYFLLNGHVSDQPGGRLEHPQQVRGLAHIVAISAGAASAVALTRTGRVIAWGDNTFEQLGQPQAYVMATLPIGGVVKVFAGGDNAYAIRADGTVWAWGRGVEHRLASGGLERCPQSSSEDCSSVPVRVPGLRHVASVGAGDGFDYALTAGGALLAWGNNSFGQLGGRKAASEQQLVRVAVPGRVVQVQAGLDMGLAIVQLTHRSLTPTRPAQPARTSHGRSQTAARPGHALAETVVANPDS